MLRVMTREIDLRRRRWATNTDVNSNRFSGSFEKCSQGNKTLTRKTHLRFHVQHVSFARTVGDVRFWNADYNSLFDTFLSSFTNRYYYYYNYSIVSRSE